jgi:hypothetical protein
MVIVSTEVVPAVIEAGLKLLVTEERPPHAVWAIKPVTIANTLTRRILAWFLKRKQ